MSVSGTTILVDGSEQPTDAYLSGSLQDDALDDAAPAAATASLPVVPA